MEGAAGREQLRYLERYRWSSLGVIGELVARSLGLVIMRY